MSSKTFSIYDDREGIDLPPSCCSENIKKRQNVTFGYFGKNSEKFLDKWRNVKIEFSFDKTCTYEDFYEQSPKISWTFKG